ncbi:MAG: putative response regulator, CheY [Pedosphaera sp.]|nr:putative response regulator, CheY [Pedosphaera sp.]
MLKTLLIVDDREDDVLLTKRAFQRAGSKCQIEVCQNGEQAIQYLAGQGNYRDRAAHPLPELILLDIKMPGIDGFQVLQWLRNQAFLKAIPVVMLTTSDEPKDVTRAYKAGANSYLVKPIDYEQLEKNLPLLLEYWLHINTAPSKMVPIFDSANNGF